MMCGCNKVPIKILPSDDGRFSTRDLYGVAPRSLMMLIHNQWRHRIQNRQQHFLFAQTARNKE